MSAFSVLSPHGGVYAWQDVMRVFIGVYSKSACVDPY